jgi:hypothetical protein
MDLFELSRDDSATVCTGRSTGWTLYFLQCMQRKPTTPSQDASSQDSPMYKEGQYYPLVSEGFIMDPRVVYHEVVSIDRGLDNT